MLDALDLNSVANKFDCMCGSHSGRLGYMVPTWGWSHHALGWYIAICITLRGRIKGKSRDTNVMYP